MYFYKALIRNGGFKRVYISMQKMAAKVRPVVFEVLQNLLLSFVSVQLKM